jgi:hypothetical protein
MKRIPLLAVLLAACAPNTVGPGGSSVVDGATPDGPAADRALPDAGTPDGLTFDVPGADASTTVDATTVPDATTTVDLPMTTDAPVTPPDAASSLLGTWRAVRYEFMGDDGRMFTLTDRDTPVPDPGTGMATPFRINGLMFLGATHLALSFGLLGGGYFYTYAPTSVTDQGYTANGYGVPGVLDDARGEFQIPGAPTPTRFVRNADGTVTFVDAMSGARTTYARTSGPGPALPSINAPGLAIVGEGVAVAATRPRVALLWDLRGDNRWFESNGTAVRFVGRFATFPLTLTAPPTEAVVAWMGSQVAVARIGLYDDNNNDLDYDFNADRLVGLSPVVVTWRAAAAFTGAGAGHFPLRHVPDGLRYGHAHTDFALGREDVTPWDHTVPVAPGVPVQRPVVAAIPEIL